jgi:hypothetical protein
VNLELAGANLPEPTCQSQLARANLSEPACQSQLKLARVSLSQNGYGNLIFLWELYKKFFSIFYKIPI